MGSYTVIKQRVEAAYSECSYCSVCGMRRPIRPYSIGLLTARFDLKACSPYSYDMGALRPYLSINIDNINIDTNHHFMINRRGWGWE